jgi:hypothetical protein
LVTEWWDDAILEQFSLISAQQSLHFALQLAAQLDYVRCY